MSTPRKVRTWSHKAKTTNGVACAQITIDRQDPDKPSVLLVNRSKTDATRAVIEHSGQIDLNQLTQFLETVDKPGTTKFIFKFNGQSGRLIERHRPRNTPVLALTTEILFHDGLAMQWRHSLRQAITFFKHGGTTALQVPAPIQPNA